MTSSENPTKKSPEDELTDAITCIDTIKEKLSQYVYQRLMTKQLESLKTDLTSLQDTLAEVKVRLRSGSRDSSADERERFSTLTSGIDSSLDGTEYYKEHSNGQVELIDKLRSENHRLQEEIKELEQESKCLRDHYNEKLIDSSFSTHNSSGVDNNSSLDFPQAVQELNRCKEALKAMKADRRQLKSDNLDLHMQMKQLYCTLGDKEAELRDFIRNYDQRKQDHLDTVRKLKEEKERVDCERRELMRKTKEAVEQNLILKSQLEVKDTKLVKLQQEFLKLLPGQRSSTMNSVVKGCLSQDSLMRGLPSASFNAYDMSRVRAPTVGGSNAGSISGLNTEETYARCADDTGLATDVYIYHRMENSPSIPRTASITEGQLQASREKALRVARMSRYRQSSVQRINRGISPSSCGTLPSSGGKMTKLGVKFQSTSTIDEVESQSNSPPPIPPVASRLSFLSQENYEEKLKAMEEAEEIPVSQWRANHVLAWLELKMNMESFGPACSDNIKSGKILLGLSDPELESALRLTSSLHRRKMRLAIEDLRDPSSIQYSGAATIDHMWVSHEWIYSLGLPQHSQAFENQLVDGRLLQVLSKKDLDKHLGVHKKSQQASIQYGIDLLRMLEFNKQVLQERRNQSKQNNNDTLVWSNQQISQWAERIDLQEYAQNLKESGIHGAVLVLDSSFTADSLATVLGIPNSKSYVRRHLSTELEAIIRPARTALESVRTGKRNSSSFVRSFSPANRSESEGRENSRSSGSARKLSFRGSIGKAFGRKGVRDSSSNGSDARDSSRPGNSSHTETSSHSNSSET